MGNGRSSEKGKLQQKQTLAPQTDTAGAESNSVSAPEDPRTAQSVAAIASITTTEALAVPAKPPSQWTETDKTDKATVLAAVKVNGYDVQFASDELKDDFEIGMTAIKANSSAFSYLGPKAKANKALALAAVSVDGFQLGIVDDKLRDDLDLIFAAMRNGGASIISYYVPTTLKEDKEFVLKAVDVLPYALSQFSSTFQDDEDVINAILNSQGKLDGNVAGYFSERFQKNDYIMEKLIRKPGGGSAMAYASGKLRGDYSLAVVACADGGCNAYNSLPEELKNDRDIVITTAKNDPGIFWSLPSALKDDREIYLAIVSNNDKSGYLYYPNFPTEMQADLEIARIAVNKEGGWLEYAPAELKDDRDLVLSVVKQFGERLIYASDRLKDDEEVVTAAATKCYLGLAYCSDRLRDDESMVMKAVAADGQAFQSASERLRGTKTIALEAFRTAGIKLQHASEELRDDFDVVLRAYKQCPDALQYASDRLKDNEFLLCAVPEAALTYCSERLKGYKPLVLESVKKQGLQLQYADESMRNDFEVVSAAMDNNIFAFQYASEELRSRDDLRNRVIEAAKEDYDCSNFVSFGGDVFKDFKEVAIICIAKTYYVYSFVSDRLKDDRDVAFVAINAGADVLTQRENAAFRNDKELALLSIEKVPGFVVSCLSETLRADYDVCLAAVKANYTNAYYLDPATISRRDILIERAKSGAPLGEMPGPFDDDDEIVTTCVTRNYENLGIARDRFKSSVEFVGKFVDQYPRIVTYAAENVRSNRDLMARAIVADAPGTVSVAIGDVLADAEVMLAAAKQYPDSLSYAAESLKADKDFVRRVATTVAPCAVLQHAAEGLRDDKDFVLECMSLAGDNFAGASERLRGDREVFETARKSIGIFAITYAAGDILKDKSLFLEIFNSRLGGLSYYSCADQSVKGDKEVFLAALNCCTSIATDIPEALKEDMDVAKAVVNFSGVYYVRGFSETVRDNEEFLTSILSLGALYVYTAASARLQSSRDFAFKCLTADRTVYSSLIEDFRADKEILLFSASGCDVLQYCAESFRDDKDLLLANFDLLKVAENFSLVSERLRGDKKLVIAACVGSYSNLQFASEAIRGDRNFLLNELRPRLLAAGMTTEFTYMASYLTPELLSDSAFVDKFAPP